MKKSNFKITLISGIILSLIIGVFFIWSLLSTPEESKPQFTDTSMRTPDFNSLNQPSTPETPLVGDILDVPTLPLPKPDTRTYIQNSPIPSTKLFVSFFEKINKAAEEVQKALENIVEKKSYVPTQQKKIGASELPDTILIDKGIQIEMTNKEFHRLYPDFFIEGLMQAQLLLEQYDPNYQSISEITTDEHVRYVQEKEVAALYSANMLTKEEAERYITTIRFTLPQLQLKEIEMIRRGIYKTDPKKQQKNGLFLLGLLTEFRNVFVKECKAGTYCGYCVILPECYNQRPAGPTIGYNTWTAYCYCTGCLSGLGCLDRCGWGVAAIWDPMTGICGCG